VSQEVEQLSCREFVELVTDFLEGALPEEERLRFEDHISRCDGCKAYLEQIRQMVAVSGRSGGGVGGAVSRACRSR